MQPIDLRSDTVTLPTEAMREAMARAPLGDDVYGEDPTVRRLEAMAAERLGKERAVFVPSGTMANQISLRVHCRPGDTLLAGEGAHLLLYEGGGAAALWGVQIDTVGSGGFFTPDDLRRRLPPDDEHYARVGLVAVENTHNSAGGRIWPKGAVAAVAESASAADLPMHLDGARLFNAVIASNIPAHELAAPFETVAFCLSKGLGAPVGSLVCGDRDRIREARRARKMVGGGMRQAGVIAAAGIYALDHQIDRLARDHANATTLAAGLGRLGFQVERAPETNMVMFHATHAGDFCNAARERSVLMGAFGKTRVRAVTHLDVSESDVQQVLERLSDMGDHAQG